MRVFVFLFALLGIGLLGGCGEDAPEAAPEEQGPARAPQPGVHFEALASAIGAYVERTSAQPDRVDRSTEFVDLNSDGEPDALVLMDGPEFRTERGYTLAVFHYDAAVQQYREVSTISYVRPPVLVGTETSGGWRDIIMGQLSDEEQPFFVRLQYDGGYPSDPTSLPALPDMGSVPGQMVFME